MSASQKKLTSGISFRNLSAVKLERSLVTGLSTSALAVSCMSSSLPYLELGAACLRYGLISYSLFLLCFVSVQVREGMNLTLNVPDDSFSWSYNAFLSDGVSCANCGGCGSAAVPSRRLTNLHKWMVLLPFVNISCGLISRHYTLLQYPLLPSPFSVPVLCVRISIKNIYIHTIY